MAVGALGLLGVALYNGTVRATAPADIVPFLNSCQNFTQAMGELALTPGRTKSERPVLFAARTDWFLLDILAGTNPHFAFKEGSFTFHTRRMAQPAPPQGVPSNIVADLWSACRSGFPGTQWIARSPSQDGYWYTFTNINWFKADLPYAWADDFHLYFAVNKKSKAVTDLVWRFGTSTDWGRLRVAAMAWDVSATPSFNRLAPPTEIVPPPRFQHIK